MSNRDQINKTLIDDQKLEEEYKSSKTLKESTFSRIENDEFSILNEASNTQILFFEFMAVFLFTYGYQCFISVNQIDAQAAGVLLMAICFSGSLCGGNINPVITVANCLKTQCKYKPKMLSRYLLAQFSGAAAALAWAYLLGHDLLAPLALNGVGDIFKVMANEAMGVFILVLFTLLLSNPNTTFIQSELSGYISIAIFYHIARCFAPYAGLTINPAITLCLALQYLILGKSESLSNCWAWLVGDVIGCAVAVVFYVRIYEPIIKEIRQIKRKSQNFESITSQSQLDQND